jgi:hypothetical protein
VYSEWGTNSGWEIIEISAKPEYVSSTISFYNEAEGECRFMLDRIDKITIKIVLIN